MQLRTRFAQLRRGSYEMEPNIVGFPSADKGGAPDVDHLWTNAGLVTVVNRPLQWSRRRPPAARVVRYPT
jgi:hypothetical protein